MDKSEIFVLIAALLFVAVRLYMKYIRKGTGKSGTDAKPPAGKIFSSSSENDDYEPYSKK
jgi:hypothetical protein